MKSDTSKFKNVRVIWDDGSFAIATGNWNGQIELSVGCRWYEDGAIGYPQTFGKPQWMLLPRKLGDFILSVLVFVNQN